MRGDVLKVVVKETTYHAEEPKQTNGLVVTLTAIADEGNVARILHRDRLNLDRARDRDRFAETAGTGPADLNEVRDRLLDFLAPSAETGDDAPEPVDPVARQAALDLLDAPDLLARAERVVRDLGYAGEAVLPLLVLLVFVSRLLRRPINLVVAGPSAGGKSFVVMLVARLFPPAATYALNGMSERLLAYTEADLRHRVLIVQEAAALHRDGVGAALLRSVAWEGSVAYETVEKSAAGLKARRIEKPGPTGFVTTTTKSVEPELETRVLTVQVADDPETTRVILRTTATRANGHAPSEPDLRPWHEAQRWLAQEGDREITIPFAERLAEAYRADQVRSRRDFTQLLGLIQASALLFQRQRGRDERGRVVAAEADYRAAYGLAAPIFGAIAAEGATAATRATVGAVAALVSSADAEPATVNQVAQHLGVHKSVASRRVKVAVRDGWLVNEEDRKGRPLKLRPGDPLPEDRPALPHPDELFADPGSNRATGQPSVASVHASAEADGCLNRCGLPAEGNGPKEAVEAVADRMRGELQPVLWRMNAENGGGGTDGCLVACPEVSGVDPFEDDGRWPEDEEDSLVELLADDDSHWAMGGGRSLLGRAGIPGNDPWTR